jgi:hypothetical protein
MLKLKISGYYKAGKDKKNYNGVDVVIPNCEKEVILGNVINRVVPVIFADYTERGKCHVDKVTKDDKMKPSYDGKEIKELEEEDIQQLAIAYGLSEVPLYHQESLFDSRRKAYRAYCNKVKEMNLDVDYDFENAEDFTLGNKRKEKAED